MVRDSIRARTLRNASHAEQSAPPDGTIIELRPRGLQQHLSIQVPRYANMPAAELMPLIRLACCWIPDILQSCRSLGYTLVVRCTHSARLLGGIGLILDMPFRKTASARQSCMCAQRCAQRHTQRHSQRCADSGPAGCHPQTNRTPCSPQGTPLLSPACINQGCRAERRGLVAYSVGCAQFGHKGMFCNSLSVRITR